MSNIQTIAAKTRSARVAQDLLLALGGATTGKDQDLVGSTVHPVFHASIPDSDGIDVTVAAVPEPASGALSTLGAIALMAPLRRPLGGPKA